MPRILFVTTKIGFGHERVSNTLALALKNTIPECNTKTVTYFDFFPPRFQRLINAVYVYGLKLFPNVFGYIYLAQKKYKGGGVEFWFRIFGKRYAGVIKTYNPDLIIITQGLACQWLGRLKKRGLVKCPLAAVMTDFVVHPFWVHTEIDFYITAAEFMKEDLISRGVSADKVSIGGIPIDPRFGSKQKKEEKDITALVMGGGWGLGKIDSILTIIDKLDFRLRLLVVTGRNRKLYRRLKKKKFNLPVRLYGLVDNISELMAEADIVITKPGGVTISELLAFGLVSILWDVIPGQEEENADYLIKNDAALKVEDVSKVRDVIIRLVENPKLRLRMQENSRKLGKPDSTLNAIKCLEELL